MTNPLVPRSGHLPECETKHAPDMYREELAAYPDQEGGYADFLRRRIADSDGIHYLMCVPGCPRLEAAKARGRVLAEEHDW